MAAVRNFLKPKVNTSYFQDGYKRASFKIFKFLNLTFE